ncbi:MAG: hypothetical protein HWD84_10510 [Flavobacteriaceae bacterium]|nr:hypothetical protein [Flavobacteriaceae bacterium]
MAIKILSDSNTTKDLMVSLDQEGFQSDIQPKIQTRSLDALDIINLALAASPYLERVIRVIVIKTKRPVRVTTSKRVIKVTPQQLQDSKTVELINQIGSSDGDAVIEFV